MISAFEITGIILLFIGVALVVWWYIEAANYDTMLDDVPFAMGANMIYNPDGENTVNMSCPDGKQICVYQATQICTNPDSHNFENPDTDPIVHDLTGDNKGNWAKFNKAKTVDLTADMNSACGTGAGKSVFTGSCSYKFDPSKFQFGTNNITCEGDNSAIHLIAAYTCQNPNNENTKICNPTTPPS